MACCFAILTAALSSVFLVSSMTVLQIKVPDAFRGRVMGIHSITFSMISLGGLAAGTLAAQFSAPVAVVIGALVVLSSVIWVVFKVSEIAKIDLNLKSKQTESLQ
jgi:MFS family permease